MKKVTLCMLLLAITLGAKAQEKQKEAGLQFSSFNSFGLTYKSGNSKSLWRYNLLSSSITDVENDFNNNDLDQAYKVFSITANIGKEFRTAIDENFEFRYGFDLGFGYSSNKQEGSYYYKRQAYTPMVNAVIGFNYVINTKFVIGAEILPHVSYTFGDLSQTDQGITYNGDLSGWAAGLNSNSARLSLAYRF